MMEEMILRNSNKTFNWDQLSLQCGHQISLQFILDNSHLPWNWQHVSNCHEITVEILKSRSDINWNMRIVSCSVSITWKDIQRNPSIPWDCSGVSENPNITPDIIDDYPDYDWDFIAISKNQFETHYIIAARNLLAKQTAKHMMHIYKHRMIFDKRKRGRQNKNTYTQIQCVPPTDIINLILSFI